MKNVFGLKIVLVLAMVCGLLGPLAHGVTPAMPRDPEVPWPGDPDIEAIDDARLVALWEEVMLTYRRNDPFGSLVHTGLHYCEVFTAEPHRREDQEYLIHALSGALAEDRVDWNYVRTVLILMYKGMDPDERIPQLAHRMFTLPRPLKVSSDHLDSFRAMTFILGLQRSEAAAEVLYTATLRSYWGDDPMNVPSVRKHPNYGEVAIWSRRGLAFEQLRCVIPPAIRLPRLERMAAAYPEDYVPPRVDVGTEARPNEVSVDFSSEMIHNALAATHRVLQRLEREAASEQEED